MFIDPNPRRRLSPQDVAFLFLESDQTPMTIGSVAVFEGQVPYERFVENIEKRIVCTAGFMVQRQETAETASMWPRPGLVQGAWFYRGYTQMDDQQHVLSGLLSAIPVIEEAG